MRALRITGASTALLTLVLVKGILAQTNDDKGSFAIRELSASTGYAFVQLPPITIGGALPDDVLHADLITSGTAAIDWQRVTARTRYQFDLFGTYTTRARYSRLNAPGGDLAFGVSRAVGNRWRLGTGVTAMLTSSDRLAYQSTHARRRFDDSATFEELAGAVALPRSPHPDPAQAALFVPIDQSLLASDLNGDRMLSSSVRADAIYAHSGRFATYVLGSYTTARRVSSSNDNSEQLLRSPNSTAERAGVGIRYDTSPRTQLTAGFDWTQTSGMSTENVLVATVGYGWSGRKWFAAGTIGTAVRPFETTTAGPLTTSSSRMPTIVFSGALGYKFRTQTLLAEYSRGAHDEYGHGGRNTVTGFEGTVQSLDASWAWSAARSRWTARSDFSLVQRPGNFSYIYAWFSTIGIGRRLTPNVCLMGEVLFDRHGSRAFEGFHLSREGARLNLIWTPPRRRVE